MARDTKDPLGSSTSTRSSLDQSTFQPTFFWSLAAFTVISQAVLVGIGTRLTTAVLTGTHVYGEAVAAAVLEICALGALTITIALSLRRRAHLWPLHAGTIVLLIVGHVLTIYTFSWTLRHLRRPLTVQTGAMKLDKAGLAFWAVAVVLETAYFVLLLWPQASRTDIPTIDIETASERPSPARSARRSITIHLAALTPIQPPFFRSKVEPHSPTLSVHSSSPRSSIRHSVHQALRPMSSKTRLMTRHSFTSHETRSMYSGRRVSFDTVRDGFESWDTTAIEEDLKEDGQPGVPRTRGRLETIPGSRPASPAKALDGPFPLDPAPEEISLPESPVQSPTTAAMPDPGSIHGLSMLPRRPSAAQASIHPLFRSDSPNPPPLPSPGTIITASPLAGQIMSPELALGARRLNSSHGNRPGSPIPMSPTHSRAGSIKGLHLQPDTHEEPVPPMPAPSAPTVADNVVVDSKPEPKTLIS